MTYDIVTPRRSVGSKSIMSARTKEFSSGTWSTARIDVHMGRKDCSTARTREN